MDDRFTDSELAMGIGNSEDTCGGGGGQGGKGSGAGDGRESGGRGGEGRGEGDSLETVNFSKLSKISIAVTAQTTGAIISFYFSGQSSSSKVLLVSTMVTNLLGYLSSLSSTLLLNYKRRRVAGLLGGIGIVAFALGFIQVIALSLPANLVWIVVLPCLAFLLVFVMVICITKLVRKGPPQFMQQATANSLQANSCNEAQLVRGRKPRAISEEEPSSSSEEEEPLEVQVLNKRPRADAQARWRKPRATNEEDHIAGPLGVQGVSADLQKQLMTVKGTIGAKALAERLKEKLKRDVEIVQQKEGGNDGEKDDNSGGGGKKKGRGDGGQQEDFGWF